MNCRDRYDHHIVTGVPNETHKHALGHKFWCCAEFVLNRQRTHRIKNWISHSGPVEITYKRSVKLTWCPEKKYWRVHSWKCRETKLYEVDTIVRHAVMLHLRRHARYKFNMHSQILYKVKLSVNFVKSRLALTQSYTTNLFNHLKWKHPTQVFKINLNSGFN